MSAGIQAWGKKVLVRYAKADYKPEQIEKAIRALPDALLPEKKLSVFLQRKNGLDTITIHKNHPILKADPGDSVIQQGYPGGVVTLLRNAFNHLQARSQPKAPAVLAKAEKRVLKPLGQEFEENKFGTRINYFDKPARISD